MPTTLWIVLFDLFLLYILFGGILRRHLCSKLAGVRMGLKEALRALAHYAKVNRDQLAPAQAGRIAETAAALTAALTAKESAAAKKVLLDTQNQWDSIAPPPKSATAREYMEVIVVAFSLAFAARSLLLQPFKIPTGSMQPTLYGIHFTPLTPEQIPTSPLRKLLDFLHYSRRYVDIELPSAYSVHATPAPSFPFFPNSNLILDGRIAARLPGEPGDVIAYAEAAMDRTRSPQAARRLTGALESGDHLFVDRTSFYFREPRRGDITVFMTDDIRPDYDFRGRFYIKRLAGLPGDELYIKDRRLYIKPAGETAFRLMDGSASPAYPRLYSLTGGYRGYCHIDSASRHLDSACTAKDPVKLGPDEYFMLGDNSERSADSRVWGVVPRKNLVGRAAVCWWPLSRRWGLTDRAEPDPKSGPTPPTIT